MTGAEIGELVAAAAAVLTALAAWLRAGAARRAAEDAVEAHARSSQHPGGRPGVTSAR